MMILPQLGGARSHGSLDGSSTEGLPFSPSRHCWGLLWARGVRGPKKRLFSQDFEKKFLWIQTSTITTNVTSSLVMFS